MIEIIDQLIEIVAKISKIDRFRSLQLCTVLETTLTTKTLDIFQAGAVIVWDPETGKQCGRVLTGHKQWITAVSWQPLHLAKDGERVHLFVGQNLGPYVG